MGYRSRVRHVVARVRRFWVDRSSEPSRREPFCVACGCGQQFRGLRRRHHQVLHCPGCGASVFVLACSPYPDPAGGPATTGAASIPSRATWRLPILAGVLTLIVVVAVYIPLLWHINQVVPTHREESAEVVIQRRMAAGVEALAREDFAEAARELAQARTRHERQPDTLPASEARRLHQLVREADLMTKRLPRSLDQMLRDWSALADEDVEKLFGDARDRSVFFDLEIQRDGTGQYQYERRLGPALPSLELHELKLLNRLPLQNARQRVVFGARLSGWRRDALGKFIVSFDPDSGVLVTEESVARVCCPPVEENLRVVLERQKLWALEMP